LTLSVFALMNMSIVDATRGSAFVVDVASVTPGLTQVDAGEVPIATLVMFPAFRQPV
jgi:hypothetical protein